jgi:hypothetical protein
VLSTREFDWQGFNNAEDASNFLQRYGSAHPKGPIAEAGKLMRQLMQRIDRYAVALFRITSEAPETAAGIARLALEPPDAKTIDALWDELGQAEGYVRSLREAINMSGPIAPGTEVEIHGRRGFVTSVRASRFGSKTEYSLFGRRVGKSGKAGRHDDQFLGYAHEVKKEETGS